MTAEASRHAGRNPIFATQTRGLSPDDPALAVPRADHTVYVVPQRVDDGWRGYRRGPPGDLEEFVVDDQTLGQLASSEASQDVRVIDTPAWPAALAD